MSPTTTSSFPSSHPTPPSRPRATQNARDTNELNSSDHLSSYPRRLKPQKKKKRPSLPSLHSNLDPLLDTASTTILTSTNITTSSPLSQQFGDPLSGRSSFAFSEGDVSFDFSLTPLSSASVMEERAMLTPLMGDDGANDSLDTFAAISLRSNKRRAKKKVAAADFVHAPTSDTREGGNVSHRRRRGLHSKSASLPSSHSTTTIITNDPSLIVNNLFSDADLGNNSNIAKRRRRMRAVTDGVSLDLKLLWRQLGLESMNDLNSFGLSNKGSNRSQTVRQRMFLDFDGARRGGHGYGDVADKVEQSAEEDEMEAVAPLLRAQQSTPSSEPTAHDNNNSNTLARVYAAHIHPFHAPPTVLWTQTQNSLPVLLEDDAQQPPLEGKQHEEKQQQHARRISSHGRQRSRIASAPATLADGYYSQSFSYTPHEPCTTDPTGRHIQFKTLHSPPRLQRRLPASLREIFGFDAIASFSPSSSPSSSSSTYPISTSVLTPLPSPESPDWIPSPVENQSSVFLSRAHFSHPSPDSFLAPNSHERYSSDEDDEKGSSSVPTWLLSPVLVPTIPPPSPPLSPLLVPHHDLPPTTGLPSTPHPSSPPLLPGAVGFPSSSTSSLLSTESSASTASSSSSFSSRVSSRPLQWHQQQDLSSSQLDHHPQALILSGQPAQLQSRVEPSNPMNSLSSHSRGGSSDAAVAELDVPFTRSLMHPGPIANQQTTSTPSPSYSPADTNPCSAHISNSNSARDDYAHEDKKKARDGRAEGDEGGEDEEEEENHQGVKGSDGGHRSRSRSSSSHAWSSTSHQENEEAEEERGYNSKIADTIHTSNKSTVDYGPKENNNTPCTPDRREHRGCCYHQHIQQQQQQQQNCEQQRLGQEETRAQGLGKSVLLVSVAAQRNAVAAPAPTPILAVADRSAASVSAPASISSSFALGASTSSAADDDTTPCPPHPSLIHPRLPLLSSTLPDHSATPSPLSLLPGERAEQESHSLLLSLSHPAVASVPEAQVGRTLANDGLHPSLSSAIIGNTDISSCSSSSTSSFSCPPSFPSYSLKDPTPTTTFLSLPTHILGSSAPALPPPSPLTVAASAAVEPPLLPQSTSSVLSPPLSLLVPSSTVAMSPSIETAVPPSPHEPLSYTPAMSSVSHPLPTTSALHYHNNIKRRMSAGSLLGQDPTSRFEILERLGYGSSGSVVYKARDQQEDRIIAIKKIPIGLLAAFPGEETTSEDVDYFVSWIVDHCIADEPVHIGDDEEELSPVSNNVAASRLTTEVNQEHYDDKDEDGADLSNIDNGSQQQRDNTLATAQQQHKGGRPRSHSVGSTRSRSGSVGSLKRSSSRRRTRTRSSRQLLEEERLGLDRLVRCLGCHRSDTDLWLELEYCPAGSAADLIRLSGGALSENEIGWLMSQILLAVAYLHAMGHVHGDIKAGNMLLTLDGQVKLGGSGAIMNHKEGAGERKRRRRSLTMSEFPASWLAPEASSSAPASPASPLFSSGFQQQQQQQMSTSSSPGMTRHQSSSIGEIGNAATAAASHVIGGSQGYFDSGVSSGWSAGRGSIVGGGGSGMPEATIEADIWALGVACIELCQGMPPQPQAPILSIAAAVAVAKNAGQSGGDVGTSSSSRAGTPVSYESSNTKGEDHDGINRSASSSSNHSDRGNSEEDQQHSIAMSASHSSMALSTSSPPFKSIYSPVLDDMAGSGGGGGGSNSMKYHSGESLFSRHGDNSRGVGDLTSRMSPTFWNFVARCLTPEPAARPTVCDLLQDPFIAECGHSKEELLERIQVMQAFVDQCAALTLEPLLEPLPPSKATHDSSKSHNTSAVEEGMGGWRVQHDLHEEDGPCHPSDSSTDIHVRDNPPYGSIEALRDDHAQLLVHDKRIYDDDEEGIRDPFEQRIGPWRVNLMPSRVESAYDATSYFDEAGLPRAPSNLRHENPIEWRNQRLSHPIVKQALMCERVGYITFRHSRSPSLATIVETEEERALERERELERIRERQRREFERVRLNAAAVLTLKKTTMISPTTGDEEVARKEEEGEERWRKSRAESVAVAVAVATASVTAAAAAAAAAASASSASDSGSMTGSEGGGANSAGAVAAAAAAAAAAAMAATATNLPSSTQPSSSTTLMPPNSIQRLRRQSQVERDDASRKVAKEFQQKMQQQQRVREEHEMQQARDDTIVSEWDVRLLMPNPRQPKQASHSLARSASNSSARGVGHGFLRRPLSKVSDNGLIIQAAISAMDGGDRHEDGEETQGKKEKGEKTMAITKVKSKVKKLTKIFSLQWWKGLGHRRSRNGSAAQNTGEDARK